MSQVQNATSLWLVALVIAVCLAFIVISIITTRRQVSRLQKNFRSLSEAVKGLRIAEERRFLKELKATKKEDNQPSAATPGDLSGETLRIVAGKEAIKQ
jgi:hypothetical protein